MFDHLGIEEIANEEYKLVRAMAKQIVENDIIPVRQYFDDDIHHSKYIEPLFHKILLEYGVQPILVSKRAPSLVSNCGFNEEIARGDSGIAVALACTSWAVFPLQHEPYKREDLLKKLTTVFREDKIHFGCFAMTEPEGGCDIENLRIKGKTIRTKARLEGNEWVINGVKQWASNSGIASLYLTVCTTDPNLGDDGIALIYVPYPIDGVTFGKFENKAGMQADRNCTIYFDNVRVPKSYRVAGPGDDAKLLHQNLVAGSIISGAMSVGSAQNIIEIVSDYATKRFVAGKPIKEHSINAGILADMLIGIETARTYVLNTAYMFDHPDIYGDRWSPAMFARARIAKVYAADVSVKIANKAMELMASFGYSREGAIEKHWRDNKIMQLWLGGAQLGRLDIARFCFDLREL